MANRRLPSGASLSLFETLDSTSLEAKRRAATGARGPSWIVALEQRAGYGRRGSEWRQSPGDFAGTLLFEPNAPVDRLSQLSFVAALAVAEILEQTAPHIALALKWPNDILADGGKIAGLLLELIEAPGRGEPLLALGIGINIVSKPQIAQYPTARLIDHLDGAVAPTPSTIAALLDAALARWISLWRDGGFAEIRGAWLSRAHNKGQPIRVRLPDGDVEGVFADLDLNGALVLDCKSGRKLITAGAVAP